MEEVGVSHGGQLRKGAPPKGEIWGDVPPPIVPVENFWGTNNPFKGVFPTSQRVEFRE